MFERWSNVEILSLTKADAKGWRGLKTANHGEIRAKDEWLKGGGKKFKFKKGFKGPMTVYKHKDQWLIAFDQTAHQLDVSKSHWEIDNAELFDLSHYGFIYAITYINPEHVWHGRSYIGMKMFHTGNWKAYTSSSKKLNEFIEEHGIDNFDLRILFTCKSRGELSTSEVQLQWERDVLHSMLPNGERAYWNEQIGAVRWIAKECLTEEHKAKLSHAAKNKSPEHKESLRKKMKEIKDAGLHKHWGNDFAKGNTGAKNGRSKQIQDHEGNIFESSVEAGKAHGITQQGAAKRARNNTLNWRYV